MKILCVGDVHTNIQALYDLIAQVKNEVCAVLQVGDFELYQSQKAIDQEKKYLVKLNKVQEANGLRLSLINKQFTPFDIPIYFIKGNHEDFDNLDSEYLDYLNINYIPLIKLNTIDGNLN